LADVVPQMALFGLRPCQKHCAASVLIIRVKGLVSKIQMHVFVADIIWYHFGKHLNRLALVVAGGVVKAIADLCY